MNNSENQKQARPVYLSFCTQKGGAGKSVFTTLIASYLYYLKNYNVAVIDCDFPQWSIQKMRKREAEQLQTNAFYQRKAETLFTKLGNLLILSFRPNRNKLLQGQKHFWKTNPKNTM